jgi:ABC-2 type transport system ATP-binding protein
VLISSHITDDIERIADYIVYMIQGRIAKFASKDELLSNWKTIHFKPEAAPDSVLASLERVETQMFGSTGITRNYQAISHELSAGISSGDIRVENVGLDDILISLVNGG